MDGPGAQNWRRFAKLRPGGKGLQRQARKLETVSVKHARHFILERLDNIRSVRRHAIGWLVAVSLLIVASALQLAGYQTSYSMMAPQPGGAYAEGVEGTLETINPLYAVTPAERSATRLVFSSLLSYDTSNHLRSELAESWRVEEGGLQYVVTLRPDLKWHDGRPLTREDVLFTLGLMKNPLVRSPLYASWQSIKVTKGDREHDIVFTLSRPYAGFAHALTFGIVPKHILGQLSPETLREADFNRNPIGSGPFQFSRLQVIDPDEGRSILYLKASEYYVRGQPKLERFRLHIYKDSSSAQTAFIAQEINAASGLTSDQAATVVKKHPDTTVQDTRLSNGMFVVLKQDAPLMGDIKIRQALRLATDRKAIIKGLHGYASPLEGPLSSDIVPNLPVQPGFNKAEAERLLDEAGWKRQNNQRMKDDVPLTLRLATVESGDYPAVAKMLKKQWEDIGVAVDLRLVDAQTFQQTVLVPRDYDVLLYEFELGADPDVSAYWHQSQADPRGLNLADYKSAIASEALDGAQLRLETDIRNQKYRTFVETWLADVPAVALYQPQLHYVTSPTVSSLQSSNPVVDRASRYRQVELWTVDKGRVYATP